MRHALMIVLVLALAGCSGTATSSSAAARLQAARRAALQRQAAQQRLNQFVNPNPTPQQ